jgi:GDP-L-fucose synthase
MFDLKRKRIWVAGHKGMVGQALVRRLQAEECEVLIADRRTVNLLRQNETGDWIAANHPDAIIVAAAKVGGIHANNTYPADFLYENLAIETNIIHAAFLTKVQKLVMLGSSCIYPRMAPQPIPENALLTGPLEPTNEWYALAKIVGIKLCQAYRQQYDCDFISAMPTNLYGPGDNFHPENSHVIPAILRKIHLAKINNDPTVSIWGSGKPLREFMHVDDCADAIVHLLKNYSGTEHVNVGTGSEVTIAELARIIAKVVGFKGEFQFDSTKPDGTPRKLMDNGTLKSQGWDSRISLEDGLKSTYAWFLEHAADPTLRV